MSNASILRQRLPTKAQIFAIDSLDALYGIKDDVEREILKIETSLEFQSDDADWAHRACNALALHRYVDRMLSRRIGQLKGKSGKGGNDRPDDDCDPLTLEVLAERPECDPTTLETVQAVDERIAWLAARINATQGDRDDEIAMEAGDRDEGFLAATGTVLRHMKGLRQTLQTRRGEITRAAKQAEAEARNACRMQRFIEAAKFVLDRDTFMRVWDRVDELEMREREAPQEAA